MRARSSIWRTRSLLTPRRDAELLQGSRLVGHQALAHDELLALGEVAQRFAHRVAGAAAALVAARVVLRRRRPSRRGGRPSRRSRRSARRGWSRGSRAAARASRLARRQPARGGQRHGVRLAGAPVRAQRPPLGLRGPQPHDAVGRARRSRGSPRGSSTPRTSPGGTRAPGRTSPPPSGGRGCPAGRCPRSGCPTGGTRARSTSRTAGRPSRSSPGGRSPARQRYVSCRSASRSSGTTSATLVRYARGDRSRPVAWVSPFGPVHPRVCTSGAMQESARISTAREDRATTQRVAAT